MSDYSQYDLREDDPYLIKESSCLINLLGIRDSATLVEADAQLSQIALAELEKEPVQGDFSLEHLKAIHFRVFEYIYPFAGNIRQVDILKGGKLFLPYKLIESKANEIFRDIHQESLLKGYDLQTFGKRAGYYLGRVNMVHPFREGNGRAQRVLLNQLANLNGYAILWASISGEAMALACREARTIDPDAAKLQRLISLNTVSLADI